MATFLAPSTIHYMSAELTNIIAQTPERDISDIARKILENADFPKIQVVEKEGHWFTLNNSQLELCRRLEQDGKCRQVKVDLVPISEVPEDVVRMMVLPRDKPQETTCPDNNKETATGKTDPSRSTTRGYQKLGQNEPGEQEAASDSDKDDGCSSSDNSDFGDSDSECDWSEDEGDSSDCESTQDEDGSDKEKEKSTDDERECLL